MLIVSFVRSSEKEAAAEFIYEDESLVFFKDAYPHAPVHLLVVPRKHIRSVNDLADEDRKIISEMIFIAREIAREVGVNTSGYQLTFNVEREQGRRRSPASTSHRRLAPLMPRPFAPTFVALRPVLPRRTTRYAFGSPRPSLRLGARARLGMHRNSAASRVIVQHQQGSKSIVWDGSNTGCAVGPGETR